MGEENAHSVGIFAHKSIAHSWATHYIRGGFFWQCSFSIFNTLWLLPFHCFRESAWLSDPVNLPLQLSPPTKSNTFSPPHLHAVKNFCDVFLLHNIASFPSHRLSFFLKIVQRGWLASRTVSKWAAPMMMSSTKRNEKERRIGLVSSYIILDTQRHCSKLPLVNSNFILFQNWCLRKRLSVKFEDKSRTKPK